MFKRLIISLLILSALASEGIVNLPVNFYNLYLADVNNLGFYAENQQNFQKQLNNETETNRVHPSSFETTNDGLFVLSVRTAAYLAQFRQVDHSSANLCTTDHDYNALNQQLVYEQIASTRVGFHNRDIIIKSSDNSPPQFL